jgi:hypothetical protein
VNPRDLLQNAVAGSFTAELLAAQRAFQRQRELGPTDR